MVLNCNLQWKASALLCMRSVWGRVQWPAEMRPDLAGVCACRYGAEQGRGEVRQALCDRFYGHLGRKAAEVFVSDGSKCDIGRLQMMFGAQASVAVQASRSSAPPLLPALCFRLCHMHALFVCAGACYC